MKYNIAFTLNEKESKKSRDLVFDFKRNLDHLHKDDDLLLEYFDPTSDQKSTKIRLTYLRKEQEFGRQEESRTTYFFFLKMNLSKKGFDSRDLFYSKTYIDDLYDNLTQFCLDQDF